MIKHILTLIWNKKRGNFLLFLEIFLAFIILFSVLTFVTDHLRNYNSPMGYDPEDVWVAYLEIGEEVDSATTVNVKEQLKRELNAFSEINAVSFSNECVPFGGSNNAWGNQSNGFRLVSYYMPGDIDYPEVMDLELIEGRFFNESDATAKYPPAIISREVKDLYFGDRQFLDSVFDMNDQMRKIVGVIEAYKYMGEFTSENRISIFYDDMKNDKFFTALIELNGEVPPEFEEKVNQTISRALNRNDFVIRHLETERILSSRENWMPIVALFSISGFLVINIALGLFGVLWFTINKRRPEIGLRRAIGATKFSITSQFMLEILFVALCGLLVGLFFAIQLPLLKLLDIENINYYYAMLGASGIIIVVVLICSLYPSRQAAGIHPAIALHEE